MLEEYKDVLDINDLCEVLRLGRNSVYKLLKSEEIQAFIVSGKYRIPKQSVIIYLESKIN